MQLEKFIEESIVSIVNGIRSANSKVNKEGAYILAPATIEGEPVHGQRLIDFDVMVTVSDNNKIQVDACGSGKVNVGIAHAKGSISGGFDKELGQEHKNRICFSVPYVPEAIR